MLLPFCSAYPDEKWRDGAVNSGDVRLQSETRIESHDALQVAVVVLDAVHPIHGHELDKADEEVRPSGGIVVQEIDNIATTLKKTHRLVVIGYALTEGKRTRRMHALTSAELHKIPYLCCERDAEQEQRRADSDDHPGFPLPQLRELVQDAGDDVLHDGELRVEAQREEHEEEEQGPERGHGQTSHQLWVGHKRQTCQRRG